MGVERTPGTGFCQGNALCLPFADETFDMVASAFMLVYLDQQQKILDQAGDPLHRVGQGEAAFACLAACGQQGGETPAHHGLAAAAALLSIALGLQVCGFLLIRRLGRVEE